MKGAFWLSFRYLSYRKVQTGVLLACLSVPVFLPLAVRLLLDRYRSDLTARAVSTPLIAGSKGNRFDLALSALYFRESASGSIPYGEAKRIQESGLAVAIPMRLGFRARGHPIAAVSPEYFELRNLRAARGDLPVLLGEAVLGASAAGSLGLGPGDSLFSDPRSLYDIASPPSLKMRVCGVLASTGTPDDLAVFVDIGTAWILEGFYHGHQDAEQAGADLVIERQDDFTRLSPAMVEFNEVTEENRHRFHYHGDPEALPLSAIIAVPLDGKSKTILKARMNARGQFQMLEPVDVVEDILGFVFELKKFFDGFILLLAAVTALLTGLILWLSGRLRRREMETLHRIGASRTTIAVLHGSGMAIVLAMSLLLCGAALGALHFLMPDLVRLLR